eukprot:2469308-Pyramimonas_sp.AAC.1
MSGPNAFLLAPQITAREFKFSTTKSVRNMSCIKHPGVAKMCRSRCKVKRTRSSIVHHRLTLTCLLKAVLRILDNSNPVGAPWPLEHRHIMTTSTTSSMSLMEDSASLQS